MLAKTLRRALKAPRLRHRSAEGYLGLVRTDGEAERAVLLLARPSRREPALIRALLRDLWRLDSTTLYVQVDGARSGSNVVVTRRSGHNVVATGQKFRVEVQTHEPAPNGAYRIAREYRQLGFYDYPPSERVIVTARIRAGAGRVHLLDVPSHVSHVTIVMNEHILANAARIPASGDVRFEFPQAS